MQTAALTQCQTAHMASTALVPTYRPGDRVCFSSGGEITFEALKTLASGKSKRSLSIHPMSGRDSGATVSPAQVAPNNPEVVTAEPAAARVVPAPPEEEVTDLEGQPAK